MSWRDLPWPHRAALILLLVLGIAIGSALAASPAHAQQICAADLDGSSEADGPGETASCTGTANGSWQCPLERTWCAAEPGGGWSCPLGAQYGCETPASGGVPACSPHSCIDTAANPIEDEPVIDDPGAPADGPVDAEGK